jgi:hypothetical protein
MSQSVELKAVVVEKPVVKKPARKINIKAKPVVAEPTDEEPAVAEPTDEEPMKQSIWMNVSRTPKAKSLAIVWENVEDISDDEGGTPQAAGKRLSMMKATRDQIRRRHYENNLDEFHRAGLFLNLSKPKPLETHEEQYTPFEYTVTAAYPY